jgi:hypothetical protein
MREEQCRQHRVMAHLGLPDFETVQQCSSRQQLMARRFKKAGDQYGEATWAMCTQDLCASTSCQDGCWFASRRHRYKMITEAHRMLSGRPGDLLFVTVTHPNWELPLGKLGEANISTARQWLYRRFKRLGSGVVAVGGFEASLNVELDGTSTWAGHVHLVVAGVDRKYVRKALQLEARHRKRYARPLDVRDVANLGRQLGYSLKRIARRRVAYIDRQGRQNRNHTNLSSAEQREFDGWLLGLLVGDRTILIGCRAHAGQLRLINGNGAS